MITRRQWWHRPATIAAAAAAAVVISGVAIASNLPTPSPPPTSPSPSISPTVSRSPSASPFPTESSSPANSGTTPAHITTSVSRVSPASGTPAGGDIVTITGSGFTGATGVNFGSTSATTFQVNSDSQITVTSPIGTGTVDITVVTPAGTSPTSTADQFTYAAPHPIVLRVSPASGTPAGGDIVTITGSGFTGATGVNFGSTSATTFQVNSDSQITVTSPAYKSTPHITTAPTASTSPTNAVTVDIIVVTPAGTSATSSADQFTYVVSVVP